MTETKHEELDKVQPSEFYLTILNKKRRVLFGNMALAKIEREYGSLTKLDNLQKEFVDYPMKTLPWLLRVCIKDQEGLGEDDDDILEALDDSGIKPNEVFNVVMSAMKSSLSNIGDSEKKTQMKKKK